MIPKTILIADDDPSVRQLLELVLSSQGYAVLTAENGDQLVRLAQERMPDLLLVDLMMPQLDGFEAIRQLRNDTRTAHLPMLILTARSGPDDVISGFESGADDFITKPFNTPELLARIKSHLRRAAQRPVRNPLTGLAGNVLLTEELKYRIKRNEPFALLYLDLNNFKAFNDTYGFARGDRVIKLLADVMVESVVAHQREKDFIGHIGGDDFALITTPDAVQPLCEMIIAGFDERVRMLYDLADLGRGYLEGTDRQGVPRRFPITSLSIGGVTNLYRQFHDYEEVSRIAAEMKHFAKTRPGSIYEIDTRGAHPVPVSEDRRGAPLPTVLIISGDEALTAHLLEVLNAHGYRSFSAPGVLDTHALLSHEPPPRLIVIDAQLGEPLWTLCDDLEHEQPKPWLLALLTCDNEEELAVRHGVQASLKQPFTDEEFLAGVQRFFEDRT